MSCVCVCVLAAVHQCSKRKRADGRCSRRRTGRIQSARQDTTSISSWLDVPGGRRLGPWHRTVQRTHCRVRLRSTVPQRVDADEIHRSHWSARIRDRLARSVQALQRRSELLTVGATATTSRRRGRPVIDGGSRGAVGVATQVAGSSCVDVAEADTYAWECEAYAWECGACAGNADEWGVNVIGL